MEFLVIHGVSEHMRRFGVSGLLMDGRVANRQGEQLTLSFVANPTKKKEGVRAGAIEPFEITLTPR